MFAPQIRAAFPFSWGPYNGPSWPAIFFWTLLVLFIVLFTGRQWAINNQRSREQEQLVGEAERLRKLVRTMPPKGFLGLFEEVFHECESVAGVTLSQTRQDASAIDADEIKDSIRRILDGVVTLAKRFDSGPQDVTYAANIMRYMKYDELVSSGDCDKVAFIPDDARPKLSGVLRLELELSTTSATKQSTPDEALDPLMLPIPETTKSDGLWRVLPGAPMAFVTGHLDGYRDSSTLGTWCRENGDFRESTCAAVELYFGESTGETIRSFVSLPLSRWGQDLPIGVLNLHRNRIGMLEERSPAKHFNPLTLPFRSMLVELLMMLSAVESDDDGKKTSGESSGNGTRRSG